MLVGDVVRLDEAGRAALDGRAEGVVGVGDRERDDLHAVAVAGVVLADGMAGDERAGEHEPDAALPQDEGDAVAHAGLEARVGDLLEPERLAVEVGRLGGVAHPQLDVVDAVERHEVLAGGLGRGDGLRAHASSL